MAFLRTALLIIVSFLFVSMFIQEGNSMRSSGMEPRLKRQVPLLASLPRGNVPSSGGSHCTFIPGRSGNGPCSLKEKNFAGGGAAFFHRRVLLLIDILSASMENNETSNKDSTS
ncbi:Hypothetical predicted protein [Olea europaea subsp. europaea]|uniref:Uncharacterized protein n=1 Tax=Olea europaea subsp. europaea TaxID=158383 RepID=A0A8S0UUJ7_OLEEU|nr:Hypothetical predicted protein [Olea europaea subsp. europaea]